MSQEIGGKNTKRLTAILTYLILLSLTGGIIGCGGGGEATSPEGREIERFLNDKQVKAVLQEQWDIFNEFNYGYSLYAESGYSWSWYSKHWYKEMQSLSKRATENYKALRSIKTGTITLEQATKAAKDKYPYWDEANEKTRQDLLDYYMQNGRFPSDTETKYTPTPSYPQLLIPFMDGVEVAMKDLLQAMGPPMPYALQDFALRRAFQEYTEAWLNLRNICQTNNIDMPWPRPSLPSWPRPTSRF